MGLRKRQSKEKNVKSLEDDLIILNYNTLESSFKELVNYNKPYKDKPTLTPETKINKESTNFEYNKILNWISYV